MSEYLLSYTFRGRVYGLSFFAESQQEAETRLVAVKNTLVLDGKLEERVEMAAPSRTALMMGVMGMGEGAKQVS